MKGVSLIEILISMVILNLLILLISKSFINACKLSERAYYDTLAIEQIASLQESLKSNNFENVEYLIDKWNSENRELLPNAIGKINKKLWGWRVTICWGKNYCIKQIIT